MQSNKLKMVYVITKRGEQSFWNRVGVGFVNSDGSLNVRLDAMPVSGELHIRDYVAREERLTSRGGDELLGPFPSAHDPHETGALEPMGLA